MSFAYPVVPTPSTSIRAFCASICLPPELNVMDKFLVSLMAADAVVLALAELNGAECGEVLCILRSFDQIFRLRPFRNFNFALLPHARNFRLPCFAHAADERVGTAEQQHVRTQCVPARQHAQGLQNDGL